MSAAAMLFWGWALIVFALGVVCALAALAILYAVVGIVLGGIWNRLRWRRTAAQRAVAADTVARALIEHGSAELGVRTSEPAAPTPRVRRPRWVGRPR